MLYGHELCESLLLHLFRNIVGIMPGTIRSLFLRISESPHPFKACPFHKVEKLLEILFRLTRESNHKCGAQMNTWHPFSNVFYQVDCFLPCHMAMHALQHMVGNMLQGNIEIVTHIIVCSHNIEQFHGKLVGIGIMQSNPFHSFDSSHFIDERGDVALSVPIHTIIREFLLDYLKLLNPFCHQVSHLLQNILFRSRHMLSCDDRNGTISTMAVASFRNLDISIMRRRGEMAVGMTGRNGCSMGHFGCRA